jgi:ADP-ribose pyrophosphatase YjhB (NUDIX family)
LTAPPKPPDAPSFASFDRLVPEGDSLPRLVCRDCGHIHYVNPKIVTGAVITHEGKFLLARRAIHPRKGFWTIPAGYLEERETTEAGAARESMEEAGATIAIDALLAVYSIPRISQVQLIYRATLKSPGFAAGPESLEVGLFAWDEIPWYDLAFPSVHWSLNYWRQVEGQAAFAPFGNPPGDPGDALPGVASLD